MADPDIQGLEGSLNHLGATERATRNNVNSRLRGQNLDNNTPEQYADRVNGSLGDYADMLQGVHNEVPPMRERVDNLRRKLESYQKSSWINSLYQNWKKVAIGTAGGFVMLFCTYKGCNSLSTTAETSPKKPETKLEEKVSKAAPKSALAESDLNSDPLRFYTDAMSAMKERATVYKDMEKMAREHYRTEADARKAKIAAEQRALMGYK